MMTRKDKGAYEYPGGLWLNPFMPVMRSHKVLHSAWDQNGDSVKLWSSIEREFDESCSYKEQVESVPGKFANVRELGTVD